MKASAVSGAQTYPELCMAAKNEEKRQAELKKRQEYKRPTAASPAARSFRKLSALPSQQPQPNKQATKQQGRRPQDRPRCYNCGSTDHLARDCKAPKTESNGRNRDQRRAPMSAKAVLTTDRHLNEAPQKTASPLDFLASSSSESEEDSDIRMVRLEDKGSHPMCARVCIQGVPAYGIVDTGADIAIIGGELFKKVAAVARLKKKDFKEFQ